MRNAPRRRVRPAVLRVPLVLGCLSVSLLGSVACTASNAVTTPPRSTAVRALKPASAGCRAPARRAFAEAISPAGGVTWQLRLPTNATQSGAALQPLVLGGTAVLAEENAVYATRVADGGRLWHRSFAFSATGTRANMVSGLWQWRGTVVVLVGQASPLARLISLNPATGAVRWTLKLPAGVLGSQALTGDGGLALLRGDASLLVVDLATGHVRWSRPAGQASGPVAVGGVVVAAANAPGNQTTGTVTGYDLRTGRPAWKRTGMPRLPELQVAGGRVVVFSYVQVSAVPGHLIALSPVTGRTLWRLTTSSEPAAVSSGPAGLAVVSYGPSGLYLVNPVSGRLRWHRPVFVLPGTAPLVTGADVVLLSGPPERLTDLRAGNGSVRWSVPQSDASYTPQPVVSFGADFVLSIGSGGLDDPARLAAYRQATGAVAWTRKVPTAIQVPPAVAGDHLLVQPTDLTVRCPLAAPR
jgi:outer membrane protein assembly factor BamB